MIAYIGLGIAGISLVAGVGLCLAGFISVGDKLTDRAIDPKAEHPPIGFGGAAKRIFWGLAICFTAGPIGIAIFLDNF